MSEQVVIGVGNQRSPFTTDRDIFRPEVPHRSDPGLSSDHVDLSDLHGEGPPKRRSPSPVRGMTDRLTMASDEIYLRPVFTGFSDDIERSFCENFPQEEIHTAELGHVPRFGEAEQFILHPGGEGEGFAR